MPFEFGEVVLVPFPFGSQATSKQRPAVIVSSYAYNAERPDVVLMAITSQMRPIQNFGETIIHDWQSANLLKPSAIKPIFATLEQQLVIKPLGMLHAKDQAALRYAISQLLG